MNKEDSEAILAIRDKYMSVMTFLQKEKARILSVLISKSEKREIVEIRNDLKKYE